MLILKINISKKEKLLLSDCWAECDGNIFDRANMFPQQTRAGMTNVGQRNGEAARCLLRSHGNSISIVSESLFGLGHWQIIFDITARNTIKKSSNDSAREPAPPFGRCARWRSVPALMRLASSSRGKFLGSAGQIDGRPCRRYSDFRCLNAVALLDILVANQGNRIKSRLRSSTYKCCCKQMKIQVYCPSL